MPTSAQDALGTIDQFLEKVAGDEAASKKNTKKGEANTEAGGYAGGTSHPVKDEDDGTEPAKEGERSSENSKDVKEDQGEASVDSTSEAKAKTGADKKAAQKKKAAEGNSEGSAAEDHLQIGTNVQATGDDPSVETSSAKAKKEDGSIGGASSHPARTDNDELDGHKYANDVSTAPLEKLAAELTSLGNDICAGIAVSGNPQPQKKASDQATDKGQQKQAMSCETCGQKNCKCEKTASDQIDPDLAAQVGWEMAGLMTGNFDKAAADSLVQTTLEGIMKTAAEDSDNVADYLDEYNRAKMAAAKRAEEEAAEGGESGGESGGDAGGGEAGGGGGGGAPAASGGDPMAAMGGGAAGGAGGGDSLAQLEAVLQQLGISPEELIEALSMAGGPGGGGAGGAGAPGGAGGGDPMAAMAGGGGGAGGLGAAAGGMGGGPGGAGGGDPMAAMAGGGGGGMPPAGGMEVAASAGKTKKAAAPATDEKTAAMTSMIKELVTRSRQMKAAKAAAAKA